MRNPVVLFLLFSLCVSFLSGCGKKEAEEDTVVVKTDTITKVIAVNESSSNLCGKSIAFLGGSQCQHAFEATQAYQYNSFPLKEQLEKLGVSEICLMAKEGAGVTIPAYSSGIPNICRQAEMMGQKGKLYDYYVIWLQTNDLTDPNGMRNGIGGVSDMATLDMVKNNQQTFMGGIGYVITRLVGLNYNGRICIISPTRCFIHHLSTDDPGYTLTEYVTVEGVGEQRTVYSMAKCLQEASNYHGVPFLDAFTNTGFTIGSWTDRDKLVGIWYTTHTDGIHLNPTGYERLAPAIINFLSNY